MRNHITLTLHFMSGKTLYIEGVKDWKMEYDGDNIKTLEVEYHKPQPSGNRGIIFGALNLSRIEAMEENSYEEKMI